MAFKAPTETTENLNEMYFRWYCEELVQYGYLKRFEREPELISVFPSMKYLKEKHLKVQENYTEEISMFQETNYTYDFRLIWTEKAKYIFTEQYDPDGHFVFGMPIFVSHMIALDSGVELVSYVDVKPHYAAVQYGGAQLGSYYTFPFIQKYLFLTQGLFINKAIPIHTGKHGVTTCLFATTFVPNRYLYTDKSGAFRKIPYRKKAIVGFTEQKQGIIDDLLEVKRKKALGDPQQKLL